MYIKRDYTDGLRRLAKVFPALVLTGARQTGKTTLLKATFPHHHYVSLDLPSVAEQADRDPESFLAAHPPPVVIDEVQYAPGLFRHLKVAIDADRGKNGRFILTGSQKFPLMREVSDSLAGRIGWSELETLSLSELLVADGSPIGGEPLVVDQLEKAIVRGGFPDLWKNADFTTQDFFKSYLATYLERDLRQLLNVSSLRDFERFIRACAARNAQLLDKSSLARDVGVSPKTINSWISVLAASNLIILLEPFFANVGKRLVKSPKLYFTDTGLAAYLVGVTDETLRSSPFLGSLWETLVVGEVRKKIAANSLPWTPWFYRDDSGREIDLILTAGGKALLAECKWGENPNAKDAHSLRAVTDLVETKKTPELRSSQAFIICRSPAPHPIAGDGARVQAVDLTNFTKLL